MCGRRPGSPTSARMASSGSPLARGVGPGFLSALSWVAAWARGKGVGGPSRPAGARAAGTRGARTSRATLRSAWHGLGEQKRRLLPESQSLRCPPRSAGTASPGRAREGVADSGEAARGRAGYLQATFSAPWWGQGRGSPVPEGASSVGGPPGTGRFSAGPSDSKCCSHWWPKVCFCSFM